MADEEKVDDSELTIELLVFDEKAFIPYITKQDLEDFENLTKKEKSYLMAASLLAQRVDWLVKVALLQNRQMRERERVDIENKKWRRKIALRLAAISGAITFAAVLFGGSLGELLKAILKVLAH